MDDPLVQYHEHFLHWLWESLHFDLAGLKTSEGNPVTILDCGIPNQTDGPDFTDAEIIIGDLKWHGDVEIHWSDKDWYHHGHHKNSAFNRVVLHVIYENPSSSFIYRKDGTALPTLSLKPFLPKDIQLLLSRFHRKKSLPCAGSLHYISEEAVAKQFKKAHKEYFETKVNSLLDFFDSTLSPSEAWRRMLILSLFDGLGISHNRTPMIELGKILFRESGTISSPEQLVNLAERESGLRKNSGRLMNWNTKACRPANRPQWRVRQGAELMWAVLQWPMERWLTGSPEELWKELISEVHTTPGIGRERERILYGIAFLPSLYFLGNLFHSEQIRRSSYREWEQHRVDVPSSLLRLFKHSEFPSRIYRDKLGAVYQLHHYCKARRCHQCEVLKEAISA